MIVNTTSRFFDFISSISHMILEIFSNVLVMERKLFEILETNFFITDKR